MSQLAFDNVSLSYKVGSDTVSVLKEIDLKAEKGEFITIVGPSGCGKSSLLKLAAGVIMPSGGTVFFENEPTSGVNSKAGIMFQEPNLFPWLSVQGNIEFGPKRKGVPSVERKTMTLRYLEQMGLADFANYNSYELSGGMKQRVALARTLINDPELLLMDEPFGALDKITKDSMQNLIKELWENTGKTILFVTHDVEEAAKLGTRLIVMSLRPGTILQEIKINHAPGESLSDYVNRQEAVGLVYNSLANSTIGEVKL